MPALNPAAHVLAAEVLDQLISTGAPAHTRSMEHVLYAVLFAQYSSPTGRATRKSTYTRARHMHPEALRHACNVRGLYLVPAATV